MVSRDGLLLGVLVLASVEFACVARMQASPSVPEAPSSPARVAWNGVRCVWAGTNGSFATVEACQLEFASCANEKRPTISELTPELAAKLDPVLSSRAPTDDEGFVAISFTTREPLTADLRESLRCWGVFVSSTLGPVTYGLAADGSLRALASLSTVQKVEAQHERQLSVSH